MSAVLYPYPTLKLADQPELRVSEARLDTGALGHIDPVGAVYLHECQGTWTDVTLALSVTCETDLKAFEEKHGRVSAVVTANCLPTNMRQRLVLAPSDTVPNRWEGELKLDRANYAKRVDLVTTFTATVDGVPHRIVGQSARREVYFDKPESVRLNGTLDVRWVNFKTKGEPAASFPDSTHVVAFGTGLPAIWLNRDFEGLEALLADRKDRDPGERGVTDMLRIGIARGAWLALFADSLTGVRAGEENGEEPDWPSSDWQKQVLKQILPKIDPTKPERELLQLVVDARATPGHGEFFARAEAIIDEHLLDANKVLRSYIQSRARDSK